MIHEAWDCPALKDAQMEEDPDLQLLSTANTPTHILGLPPQLSVEEEDNLIEPIAGKHIGRGVQGLLTYDTALDSGAYSFLQDQPRFAGITATRLIHKLNCHTEGPPTLTVIPCQEAAPDNPNAWTDGSLTSGNAPFGAGGYGIWYPGRRPSSIGTNELGYAHLTDVGSIHGAAGVATAGMMLEPFPSSTRCEIAAILNCITAAGSVHIATDSDNAASIATRLLAGGQMHRPIQLFSDGDLWAAFVQACNDKGAGTVKVSWTKGHVTLASMVKGERCPQAAVHNSIADRAADNGPLSSSDKARVQLMDYYNSKQASRNLLYAAIHRRIARVSASAAALRQQREDASKESKDAQAMVDTPPPPCHPSPCSLKIALLAPPPSRVTRRPRSFNINLGFFGLTSSLFLLGTPVLTAPYARAPHG